jgi:hypothetical protein
VSARPPVVIQLDRLGHVLPLGETTDLAKVECFDVDPVANPTAKFTVLAAMVASHHAQITGQEAEPSLERPTYLVRRRGSGNIELWPRCDRAYWFRATFRPPVKRGKPPEAE